MDTLTFRSRDQNQELVKMSFRTLEFPGSRPQQPMCFTSLYNLKLTANKTNYSYRQQQRRWEADWRYSFQEALYQCS